MAGRTRWRPARLGRPVAVGPHTWNFRDPVAALGAAGALMEVADAAALAAWVDALLRDPERAEAMGRAGIAAAARTASLPGEVAAAPAGPGPCARLNSGAATGCSPRLLAPVAAVYAAATARRMARPGWRAPVPVICCGNATVGGAGKTTLALDLGARLADRRVAFLTRGHGGRVRGVHRVDPARDDAAMVGDEALLLAACAPTWVAADRAAGARAAVAAGAGVLVMDDGLQNPGWPRTLSCWWSMAPAGFGNGRVIPAGPLREPVAAAARALRPPRC